MCCRAAGDPVFIRMVGVGAAPLALVLVVYPPRRGGKFPQWRSGKLAGQDYDGSARGAGARLTDWARLLFSRAVAQARPDGRGQVPVSQSG